MLPDFIQSCANYVFAISKDKTIKLRLSTNLKVLFLETVMGFRYLNDVKILSYRDKGLYRAFYLKIRKRSLLQVSLSRSL